MLYTHNVALNIRSCRESRGYSQDYMAEMLNICQSSYANIESGKTSLSIDRLVRIASILDADVHALMEDKITSDNKFKSTANISHVVDQHDQMIKELKSEIDFIRKQLIERRQ